MLFVLPNCQLVRPNNQQGVGTSTSMTGDKLLKKVVTPHGSYAIVNTTYNGRPARILFSGGRQTAQSGIALDTDPELLFDYNERLMELIRGLRPKRVLIIGGGAFTLPRAIAQEFPDCRLSVVEVDKTLPLLASRYFGFSPTARTTVAIEDGATFLEASRETYEFIAIDVFVEETIPTAFQAEIFAHNLAARLSVHGTVAMNIIASYYGERSRTLRRQVSSFQSAFPVVDLFPADSEPSLWLPQNFILTAQHGSRDLQRHLRYQRLTLPTN